LTPPYVAVCGASAPSDEIAALAEEVGERLATAGAIVVGGGRSGVMEASFRGAQRAGGLTVGLLPSDAREQANAYCSVAIPTGMGELRNGLIVRAADAVIAVGGAYGTLSEIAFALNAGKRVVALRSWDLGVGDVTIAETPEEAVRLALSSLASDS
jgi:uncharacterized protein (TIGR00725 family)